MDDDIAAASMTDLGEPGGSVPKWSLCDIVGGGMTDSCLSGCVAGSVVCLSSRGWQHYRRQHGITHSGEAKCSVLRGDVASGDVIDPACRRNLRTKRLLDSYAIF